MSPVQCGACTWSSLGMAVETLVFAPSACVHPGKVRDGGISMEVTSSILGNKQCWIRIFRFSPAGSCVRGPQCGSVVAYSALVMRCPVPSPANRQPNLISSRLISLNSKPSYILASPRPVQPKNLDAHAWSLERPRKVGCSAETRRAYPIWDAGDLVTD
jgi:hypothetical protein